MKKKTGNRPQTQISLLLQLFMAVMFLAGAVVFTYPFLADALSNYLDQRRIENYQKQLERDKEEKHEQQLAVHEKKNQTLAHTSVIPGMGQVKDPFEQAVRNVRNPGKEYYEQHMIGAIYIPKINVSLPLFDETNDLLLDRGATVLQGTSFPTGGESTHSVITAHSGIAEKKLFTDLEEMEQDDRFYLEVYGRMLAYEVVEKIVVLPTKTNTLAIREKQDLVTLITCTPYTVNTHRLLVTGRRVPFTEEVSSKIEQTKKYHLYRLLILLLGILLVLTLFGYWCYWKFKRQKQLRKNNRS
ncbi:TPA: class C sortase [Enterococcus faecium]